MSFGHEKTRLKGRVVPVVFQDLPFIRQDPQQSALTSLEAAVCLVDHVSTAFTAYDLAVTVPALERAERVANLHRSSPSSRRIAAARKTKTPDGCQGRRK
jgi:hypothetical protein